MKTTGVLPEALASSISRLSRSEIDAMPAMPTSFGRGEGQPTLAKSPKASRSSSLITDEAANLPGVVRAAGEAAAGAYPGAPGHRRRRAVDDGLQPGGLDPRPARRAHPRGRLRRVRLRPGRLDDEGTVA